MSEEQSHEELARENERLREELAKAKAEAAEYRRAAYQFLDELFPYVPPTPEELHELMHGPPGPSILDIIEEYEKKYLAE